jgi:hypothetical protein
MSKMDAYLILRAFDKCLWGATAVVILLILVGYVLGKL